MKVSLNWVRKFTSVELPKEKLIDKIGAQLGAVDEVIELSEKYHGATVAKVIGCERHPNADKLSVCTVDVGKAKPVQVVCGAPNVKSGQTVVWLPPGATVPSTFDKDPFVLEAREIRGVMSHGMIASAKELALGDDHTGIVVLDEEHKPGAIFAEAYSLNDTIIDIENKMFTHRPDLFGMLGIAREMAGIQNQPFRSPSWYREDSDLHNDGRRNVLNLAVKNELPKLVPRFTAIAIKDIKVDDSPVWLKARLASVGVRPINNIVDLTNFFMLETAQPLHAYDYDKVGSGILGIREAKDGEDLILLGGKKIKLKNGTIVITDGKRPIGLGAVMGGADTEVDKNTKNIIIEVANFDMNATRRAAMEYGLFTDAATRFTKNQSPRQTKAVLTKAIGDVKKIAGGRVACPIVDDKHFSAVSKPVEVTADFVNVRLGLRLTANEMAKLLKNVEFEVRSAGEKLILTPPFWRTDIQIAEDIVEEVGRLYGYDRLPVTLPEHDLTPAEQDSLMSLKSTLRETLSSAGANEVLTYSFVHGSLMDKSGQDKKIAYKLANALNPDSQYYRLSLTPSLLGKVRPNIKAGFDKFAIFELGKVHGKTEIDKEGLPREFERVAFVYVDTMAKAKDKGAAYFWAKTYATHLLSKFEIMPEYDKLNLAMFKEHKLFQQMLAPFEPERAAIAMVGDKLCGVVGEYKPSVRESLKLPAFSAGFELFLSPLSSSKFAYMPLNRYPELEQDFCLRADAKLTYAQSTKFMKEALNKAVKTHGYGFKLQPLDIFQREGDKSHKQTTWHIRLWHPERTLTTQETNKTLDIIASEAKKQLNAERI